MLAQGVWIQFAHRTFSWSNEAKGNAAVHCVIVAWLAKPAGQGDLRVWRDIKGAAHAVPVSNINPYLIDAPNAVLTKRSTHICAAPNISYGSMANDDGHLILDEVQRKSLLQELPALSPFIRPFVGAQEFLNNERRWCLWLDGATPRCSNSHPLFSHA